MCATMSLITDSEIATLLSKNRSKVLQLVEGAYRLFDQGQAIEVAPSYLRPPHDARARIIAKPACLYGEQPVAGLKWIASFPGNVAQGLPRASGVLTLNSMDTGRAIGQLECAAINAHRTSASAVMALGKLHPRDGKALSIAIVGTGVIALECAKYLVHDGWAPSTWLLHDLDATRLQAFAQALQALTPAVPVKAMAACSDAMLEADISVFATSAGVPHLGGIRLRADQTLLHISLRDLQNDVIEQAANFADSAELAFTHATSLDLAEQEAGHRHFYSGDIGTVLQGQRPEGKPVIFSPFGMAILDLAVGQWALQTLR
jgi:2,3-diaminopropionate biosynthesis protein SbnB